MGLFFLFLLYLYLLVVSSNLPEKLLLVVVIVVVVIVVGPGEREPTNSTPHLASFVRFFFLAINNNNIIWVCLENCFYGSQYHNKKKKRSNPDLTILQYHKVESKLYSFPLKMWMMRKNVKRERENVWR